MLPVEPLSLQTLTWNDFQKLIEGSDAKQKRDSFLLYASGKITLERCKADALLIRSASQDSKKKTYQHFQPPKEGQKIAKQNEKSPTSATCCDDDSDCEDVRKVNNPTRGDGLSLRNGLPCGEGFGNSGYDDTRDAFMYDGFASKDGFGPQDGFGDGYTGFGDGYTGFGDSYTGFGDGYTGFRDGYTLLERDGFGDEFTLLQRDGFRRDREEYTSKDSWGQNRQDHWKGISSAPLERDGFGHDDWILGDRSLKLKIQTKSDEQQIGAAFGSEILNTQLKPINCVRLSAKKNLHPCVQLHANARIAPKSPMQPLSTRYLGTNSHVLSSDCLPSAALPNETLPNEPLPCESMPNEALPSETLPSESLPSQALPSQPFPRTACSDSWL